VRAPRIALAVALVACNPVLLACATEPRADGPSDVEHAAYIHRARCGSCHRPVEPGTRSREELVIALGRHKKRVRLSDAEWASMVDYLAGSAPDDAAP
jgi:hypothetical protein